MASAMCEAARDEKDAEVLQAILVGLSHQVDIEAVPLVANFLTYADPEVRHAAVLALTGHETPLAIESLILLTNDPDPHVRDWATFALGTQLELDTPAIRNALANRLHDPDDDTRGEALVGLARRKDERVVKSFNCLPCFTIHDESTNSLIPNMGHGLLSSLPTFEAPCSIWMNMMGMHSDDEPEMGNVIGSLSLGATRTFRIKHNKTKETMNFSVGHGTLIIMAGTMQQFWKHEIPKTKQSVGERINLTFREIVKERRP